MNKLRTQLAAEGRVSPEGRFEIIAITAGQGNGWTFSEAALQQSLWLWEGVETFVDHGQGAGGGRSLRDLGGVCHSPEWDPAQRGIKLQLRTTGPSGPLVEALAREMLAEADHKPRVGFSADVVFTADSSQVVQSIRRVLSLDLVFNPARGGAFIRALNAVQTPEPGAGPQAGDRQETNMPEPASVQPPLAPAAPHWGSIPPHYPPAASGALPAEAELEAVRALLNAPAEPARLAQEAESARALRAQMCGYLLEAGLSSSRLPGPAEEQVRRHFAGRSLNRPN